MDTTGSIERLLNEGIISYEEAVARLDAVSQRSDYFDFFITETTGVNTGVTVYRVEA